MNLFTSTTPKEITPKIRELAAKMGGEPIMVPVIGIMPCGRCHLNAKDFAEQVPGAEVVTGWVIWQGGITELEGEFHSLVRYRGELFCPTLTADGEEELMFVPDPTRKPVFGTTLHKGRHYVTIERFENWHWTDSAPGKLSHAILPEDSKPITLDVRGIEAATNAEAVT
jgi:hypothetical protein